MNKNTFPNSFSQTKDGNTPLYYTPFKILLSNYVTHNDLISTLRDLLFMPDMEGPS